MYEHWINEHKDGPTSSDGNPPRFLFYVINRMACYHCDYSGIYSSMINHYRGTHEGNDEPFLLSSTTDRSQCAICHGIEQIDFDNMIDHFEAEHSYLLKFFLVDPVYWSNDTLTGFLSIDVQNVGTFDNIQVPEHLVCYCDGNPIIPPARFFEHCAQHAIDVKCLFCPRRLSSITDLIKHGRTMHGQSVSSSHLIDAQKRRMKEEFRRVRFIFRNGLEVSAGNIQAPMRVAHDEFNNFVDKLFNDAGMDMEA